MVNQNPYLMVVLGDFNAKSNSWYTNDSTDCTAKKGRSTANYCQSSACSPSYLSCNDDHCDQWLFQEIFFLIIFPRNSCE